MEIMPIAMTGPEDGLLRVAGRIVNIADDAPDAPKLPASLLLVPWGRVHSTNGDFILDDESAAAVLEAFCRHGTDLVIDYEHQSLGGRYAAPSGLAPAAGWITQLEVRPGEGIWGSVRWTLSAARRIVRRQYRFLSPVVIVRREDRKVMALDSVALTNRPAIAGMQPVVNGGTAGTGDEEREASEQETTGNDGVPDNRQTDERKEVGMQEEFRQLRTLLSLDEQVGEQEVVKQACAQLGELIGQARQREAEQRVTCAMRAGKVSEAQKQWATQFALRDAAGFDDWVQDAPVLVPLQQVVPGSRDSSGEGGAMQRRTVIAAARGEYKANALLQQLTCERAYVNEALQQAGMEVLGDRES